MIHDLRFAFRQLIKTPAFTAAAILVLALGIGANTAVFSLLHGILFAPPAYPKPEQMVQIFSQNTKNPKVFRSFSYPTFCDIRDQNTIFSGVAAHNAALVGIGEKGNTRRTFADIVSSNYFAVLGVHPIKGRTFLPEEEKPGAPVNVAIVSYAHAAKRGGPDAVLGSQIQINNRAFTIVGVLPRKFAGTMMFISPEVWLPLSVFDQLSNNYGSIAREPISSRASRELMVIGRMQPAVTGELAEPALKTLAANLEQAFPLEQKEQTFTARPLSRFSLSDTPSKDGQLASMAPLLMGMAGIVLLVACLNLANMLLARGTARRKEIAIRLALGGSRWRIVRQLLTEGLVLAILGGAGGLLLGVWSSGLLARSITHLMPMELVWDTRPNFAILLATFVFCCIATMCFALGPAMKLSRSAVVGDLKEHAGEDVHRRRWPFIPRNPLVVVQIAFSLALLTSAGLFIHGAHKAASADTGLRAEDNFLLEIDASLGGYDEQRAQDLYRALGDRLAGLPGVKHASISATAPFGMVSLGRSIQRAGMRTGPEDKPATAADGLAFDARWNSIGSDYFPTVGLPILRGRAFNSTETTQRKGPAVAIIDEALAKKLWPEGDALGQHIQYAFENSPQAKSDGGPSMGINESGGGDIQRGESIEVVGIVPVSPETLFDKQPRGMIYVPFGRGFQANSFFFIKVPGLSENNAAATADVIRRAVRDVDPTLPVLSLKTFSQHLDANLQLWVVRAGAMMFTVFGALALVLAVVGVYGVKAYSVARRTREIGIRMALGARPKVVQWMILREGAFMLAAGIAIGVLLAAGTGKLLAGMLYQVSSLDPLAFVTAPIVLAIATFIATWLPARRATRVNPMVALRTE